MDDGLEKQVMLERVEMIARFATEGICHERDREIALGLIAEIASGNMLNNGKFSVAFSEISLKNNRKVGCG